VRCLRVSLVAQIFHREGLACDLDGTLYEDTLQASSYAKATLFCLTSFRPRQLASGTRLFGMGPATVHLSLRYPSLTSAVVCIPA
jgi:hydroxymethylpyrimidine pyrophosphatase-like HAD family hydrolase